ncbi:universal stress protein [Natronorubrum halophilum]|uniref:universal stress protein n=1 Tax=Natronorubrum halophilum TaxID=1702106 RepID=UPI000EF744AA|nr:universal stress protein [Natronorubrum halophilum]
MAVLVAYDGSAPARKAAKHAFASHSDEEIVLLRVVELADSFTEAGINMLQDTIRDREESASRKLREDVTDLDGTDDVDFRTETAIGDPARAVVEYAEDHDIDHIIVGSHGRAGVSRILLGSVAEQIVRRAPVSVTVVR